MSHFDRKYFNKANDFVRDYYKTLGVEQYKIYVGNAFMLKQKEFEKWIFNEYNEIIKLTERQRLCLKGRYCNCNNCLECPFEPNNEPNDYDNKDLGMATAKLISEMNGETL